MERDLRQRRTGDLRVSLKRKTKRNRVKEGEAWKCKRTGEAGSRNGWGGALGEQGGG